MRPLPSWLRTPTASRKHTYVTAAFITLLTLAGLPFANLQLNGTVHRGALCYRHLQFLPQLKASTRAFPRLTLQNGVEVEYVGMFAADSRFQTPSGIDRFAARAGVLPAADANQGEVPSHALVSSERVFDDYAPPLHAMAYSSVPSPPHYLFNGLVTLVYGHERVLRAPHDVTVDSQQRVIVTDPPIHAVHVLDPQQKTSFRIVGGAGRRLLLPGAVAADSDDNIYVADFHRQTILVYDRYGRFLREIGTYHGENIFQQLSGIAIDRKAGHLYATDGPRHMVYMLDLEGGILRHTGVADEAPNLGGLKVRSKGAHELTYPTHIAVGEHEVVVLDTEGTRIRILDQDCRTLGGFIIQQAAQDHADGVAIDNEGRIYVSYSSTSEIRVFSHDGQRLASFGEFGSQAGQFNEPKGLWIDAADKLYIGDSRNSRIQVFRLASPVKATRQAVSTPD